MIEKFEVGKGMYLDKTTTDLLKFLSCIMVAIHHYACYAISTEYSSNIILKAFSTQGGYLGVALFFFMSGYGLMQSERKKHLDFLPFLKKRLCKILLPSLLMTIIWIPLYCKIKIQGGVIC